MTIVEGFILGLVQGITEVLPISSTAHLILAQKVMQLENISLSFDIMMNFGSLIAIIIYFWGFNLFAKSIILSLILV